MGKQAEGGEAVQGCGSGPRVGKQATGGEAGQGWGSRPKVGKRAEGVLALVCGAQATFNRALSQCPNAPKPESPLGQFCFVGQIIKMTKYENHMQRAEALYANGETAKGHLHEKHAKTSIR